MNVTLFRTGVPLLDGLAGAPNPKPAASDKQQFGALASLYTAFSKEFASYALDLCYHEGLKTIADPFSGMGTAGEAARALPLDLRLSDLSPFAALSGAFRSAPKAEILAAADLVEQWSRDISGDDESTFFARLFEAAGIGSTAVADMVLRTPTGPEHRQEALVLFLAALSRIRLHKRFAGSNPTWVKRADHIADEEATRGSLRETLVATRNFAQSLEALDTRNRTSARCVSILELPEAPNSLDAIVTSPPYANRTDYIRHYLPASELLLTASGRPEREVRQAQIGTPLIRDFDARLAMPATVRETLERIRTHGSYASERYYYKGFLYYFADMQQALLRMQSWLRPGGLLLMVVQDTFYKDVHVATPDLLGDLAEAAGLRRIGRKDWNVRNYLSQLSPHSRKTARPHQPRESVIAFSK